MGLSVKWASCNLGAEGGKPEASGGYYQWGGTGDVSSTGICLDWDNCPYHTGLSEGSGWTKYIPASKSSYWSGEGGADDKSVLDPEDDAAHVNLGGSWRIPTYEEWQDLLSSDNCTWEWTTYNGVKGYKVISKKTGNNIFLPAVGYRYHGYFYFTNSYGYFWASSLDTDKPSSAYFIFFGSSEISWSSYEGRYRGRSIRPVQD